MAYPTCRFCRDAMRDREAVKYGVRHYAHPRCYLTAGKKLEDLHDWQIIAFPALILKEFGLLPVAEAAYERERAANSGLLLAEG